MIGKVKAHSFHFELDLGRGISPRPPLFMWEDALAGKGLMERGCIAEIGGCLDPAP